MNWKVRSDTSITFWRAFPFRVRSPSSSGSCYLANVYHTFDTSLFHSSQDSGRVTRAPGRCTLRARPQIAAAASSSPSLPACELIVQQTRFQFRQTTFQVPHLLIRRPPPLTPTSSPPEQVATQRTTIIHRTNSHMLDDGPFPTLFPCQRLEPDSSRLHTSSEADKAFTPAVYARKTPFTPQLAAKTRSFVASHAALDARQDVTCRNVRDGLATLPDFSS